MRLFLATITFHSAEPSCIHAKGSYLFGAGLLGLPAPGGGAESLGQSTPALRQHYPHENTIYCAISGYNETARPIKFTVVRIQNLAEYRTNFVFSTMRKNTL